MQMMPIWAAVWKKALPSGRRGRRSGNSLPVHRETARQNTGLTTDSQTSGEKESARLKDRRCRKASRSSPANIPQRSAWMPYRGIPQ